MESPFGRIQIYGIFKKSTPDESEDGRRKMSTCGNVVLTQKRTIVRCKNTYHTTMAKDYTWESISKLRKKYFKSDLKVLIRKQLEQIKIYLAKVNLFKNLLFFFFVFFFIFCGGNSDFVDNFFIQNSRSKMAEFHCPSAFFFFC